MCQPRPSWSRRHFGPLVTRDRAAIQIKGFIGRIKALVDSTAAAEPIRVLERRRWVGRPRRVFRCASIRSVIIKTRVVKHSKYAARKAAPWGDSQARQLFGPRRCARMVGGSGFRCREDLDSNALKAFRQSFVMTDITSEFIVSPEPGALDLKAFAREWSRRCKPTWARRCSGSGWRTTTPKPASASSCPGQRRAGADLVINGITSRTYRLQAMEVATRHLGPAARRH